MDSKGHMTRFMKRSAAHMKRCFVLYRYPFSKCLYPKYHGFVIIDRLQWSGDEVGVRCFAD